MNDLDPGWHFDPFQWLFRSALLLLGTVIVLSIAVSLLQQIWPWLVGIGVPVGIGVALVIWARWRNSRW